MQRGIEEISRDRDVGLEEVSTVGQYGPRKFMLACVESSNKLTKIHNRPGQRGHTTNLGPALRQAQLLRGGARFARHCPDRKIHIWTRTV